MTNIAGVTKSCRLARSATTTTNVRANIAKSAGTKTSSWATEEPAPIVDQLCLVIACLMTTCLKLNRLATSSLRTAPDDSLMQQTSVLLATSKEHPSHVQLSRISTFLLKNTK